MKGNVAFKFHADQEKRLSKGGGSSEPEPLKTGVILQSEFSPVLTDVEVSLWNPVPCRRSGFINKLFVVLSKKVA